MQHPVLVVMAAGMGSRYGGLKQIDPIGPHGEIIIDYSLFDAMRAGFEKVVFIISRRIEADFKEVVGDRVAEHLQVEYMFQELDAHLPAGFAIPAGRQKPWGTAHAILCCREHIDGPFAVINADDYYGSHAFQLLYDRLCRSCDRDGKYDFSMVGFRLANTLTEHGSVARGICETDATGRLINIVERTRVALQDGSPAFTEDGETWTHVPADNLVSMNMWGFTPALFDELAVRFPRFLAQDVPQNPEKAEMYIPMEVGALLREGRCTVDVLSSPDRWHGVTYREDKPAVAAAMRELTRQGLYPDRKLF